jgi:truncated hemoglobin YjbI
LIRPVTDFYARLLGSPRLAHHFEGAAIEALIAKQSAFITAALSGETRYTHQDLSRVHAEFEINDAEFDEMIAILRSTLDDHGVDAVRHQIITSTFEQFREAVVRPVNWAER